MGPADGRVSPLHWGRTRTVSCPWANCSVFELKCACKISAPKVLHSWENLIFVDLHKMSILPQQRRCCSNTVPCRTLPAHMPTCPTSQHAGIALMAFMLSGHLCSSSSSCSSCFLPQHALASLCAGKLWTPSRAPHDGNSLHMPFLVSGWAFIGTTPPSCLRQDYPGIALMASKPFGHLCSSSSSCSSCLLLQHALASSCAGKLWTPVQSSS